MKRKTAKFADNFRTWRTRDRKAFQKHLQGKWTDRILPGNTLLPIGWVS